MPLPSFTFTGSVFDILGNVAASELVENGFGSGGSAPATVTFTPNVPINQFVTWSGHAERVKPVVATVNSAGQIKRNGDTVRLLANDPGLSVSGVQYRVDVQGMKSFHFDAPNDGDTEDFASVVPVAYVGASAVTKGDRGDPVDGVHRSANTLVFQVDGVDIPNPVDISDLLFAPDIKVIYVDAQAGADDEARKNAAVTALGTDPGVIVLGAKWYLFTTGITLAYPGQGIVGQGVGVTTIDYRGTGDCLRVWDSTAPVDASDSPGAGGPVKGFRIYGWDNANTNVCGLHLGDVLYPDVDVRIDGFDNAGCKGFWGENRYTWTERARLRLQVERCTDNYVFETNASHPLSWSSWDYSWYQLSVIAAPNQNGVTLKNNVAMEGVELSLVGNFYPGTSNTGTVLQIGTTGSDTSYIRGCVNVVVETLNPTGTVGHKDINIPNTAGAPLQGVGMLQFNDVANNFAAGSATSSTVQFAGRVHCPSLGHRTTNGEFSVIGSFFPKINSVKDFYGNALLDFDLVASAVNHLGIVNAAAGGTPYIYTTGASTDISMALTMKGAGFLDVYDGNFNRIFRTLPGTANATNSIYVGNAATGNAAIVGAGGGDTNVDLNLVTQGSGKVKANNAQVVTQDGNANVVVRNAFEGFTTTATAAGTTTLTVASNPIQVFTGSTTQTVKLPTTSVPQGAQYLVINQSTGAVTVQSSGSNTIAVLAANTAGWFTAGIATPTTAADWIITGPYLPTGVVLTSPKINAVNDTSNNPAINLNASANPTYLTISRNATNVELKADGATNTDLYLSPVGTGKIRSYATTGNTPTLRAEGDDTDVGWNLETQGAGRVKENGNTVGSWVSVPSTATSTGKQGQMAADSSWLYVCTASNTWRRAAIASW